MKFDNVFGIVFVVFMNMLCGGCTSSAPTRKIATAPTDVQQLVDLGDKIVELRARLTALEDFVIENAHLIPPHKLFDLTMTLYTLEVAQGLAYLDLQRVIQLFEIVTANAGDANLADAAGKVLTRAQRVLALQKDYQTVVGQLQRGADSDRQN